MSARELQDLLRDVIEELIDVREDSDDPLAELAERAEPIREIATYDDLGIMTSDHGLVVECNDDVEFQIPIVRSR